MIKSFKNRLTREMFERTYVRAVHPELQRKAYRKLVMLNQATALQDLRSSPGNRLEALQGDRIGQYSIRVDDQWRICFEWRDGEVHEAEFCDYH